MKKRSTYTHDPRCKLTPWQARYIHRAVALRRKLTIKALANRFNVPYASVRNQAERSRAVLRS